VTVKFVAAIEVIGALKVAVMLGLFTTTAVASEIGTTAETVGLAPVVNCQVCGASIGRPVDALCAPVTVLV
jgi:hypothetical protein